VPAKAIPRLCQCSERHPSRAPTSALRRSRCLVPGSRARGSRLRGPRPSRRPARGARGSPPEVAPASSRDAMASRHASRPLCGVARSAPMATRLGSSSAAAACSQIARPRQSAGIAGWPAPRSARSADHRYARTPTSSGAYTSIRPAKTRARPPESSRSTTAAADRPGASSRATRRSSQVAAPPQAQESARIVSTPARPSAGASRTIDRSRNVAPTSGNTKSGPLYATATSTAESPLRFHSRRSQRTSATTTHATASAGLPAGHRRAAAARPAATRSRTDPAHSERDAAPSSHAAHSGR